MFGWKTRVIEKYRKLKHWQLWAFLINSGEFIGISGKRTRDFLRDWESIRVAYKIKSTKNEFGNLQ